MMFYPCAFCMSHVSFNWQITLIVIDRVLLFIESSGSYCLFTQIPKESRSFEMGLMGLEELYTNASWFSVSVSLHFFDRCFSPLTT